jgi:hypothetical protein
MEVQFWYTVQLHSRYQSKDTHTLLMTEESVNRSGGFRCIVAVEKQALKTGLWGAERAVKVVQGTDIITAGGPWSDPA